MCLGDLMIALHEQGIEATEAQVRWAIKCGRVPRPPLDKSLRFNFGTTHLEELKAYFAQRAIKGQRGPSV
jgi:hypothetical protein